MKQYMPYNVKVSYRKDAREDYDPKLHLKLLSVDNWEEERPDAEAQLSIPQALELIKQLSSAISEFCQRRDITEAFYRTEPLEVR